MAAYAAVVSLMNLIEQLQLHPRPPITLDKTQVDKLTEKIAFLLDFLEVYNAHYSNEEVERLRSRIADAAYAAEDAIESHIVNQILEGTPGMRKCLQEVKQYFGFMKKYVSKWHPQHTSSGEKTSSGDPNQSQHQTTESMIESTSTRDAGQIYSAHLFRDLHKVLEEMDLVKEKVEEIKATLAIQEQPQRIITPPIVSLKSPSKQHNTMVGFDDVLLEMLDKLTGQPLDLQIIPISGMGGIGKTTLARNIYVHRLIEQKFQIRAWAAISKEYNIKEILIELLCRETQSTTGRRESMSQMSEAELGLKLYQHLFGRKYLIVMDDIWSHEAWDEVYRFFPKESRGSRIIVTTRLSNVASYLTSGCGHKMDLLNPNQSWSLLSKTVFGDENCPPELEDIGMEIARNCKGLPLSIVVLGGLLAKSNPTQEHWEYVAENLKNLEDNNRCLHVLRTSYNELPVHLKPCFLYISTFPEDNKIESSELIQMWIAEGILKPNSGKSLVESAEHYLMDLIDRNLIFVVKSEYYRAGVCYKIHDLLRDLCIEEAQKERFVYPTSQQNTPYQSINTERRIVFHEKTSEKDYLHMLESASVARSLMCNFQGDLPLVKLRWLRVFKKIGNGNRCLEGVFQQVNLRYLAVNSERENLVFPSSVPLLWNLQTLIVKQIGFPTVAPLAIWKMPLLRHVHCNGLTLSDPLSGSGGHMDRRDDFVLHYLHALLGPKDLKFSAEVVKRIPNVKRLRLLYLPKNEAALDYCHKNLVLLSELESLSCFFWATVVPTRCNLLHSFMFPHSLKELTLCLCQTSLSWEDIHTKIGSLPHLQTLELKSFSATTSVWETKLGQFCSLKCLSIGLCLNWKHWSAESTHFPRLEHLVLENLTGLNEIPSGVGDIPTLKSVGLRSCTYSAIMSVKEILDEQEEFGNEDLQVRVFVTVNDGGERTPRKLEREEYEHLLSLSSLKFQVQIL